VLGVQRKGHCDSMSPEAIASRRLEQSKVLADDSPCEQTATLPTQTTSSLQLAMALPVTTSTPRASTPRLKLENSTRLVHRLDRGLSLGRWGRGLKSAPTRSCRLRKLLIPPSGHGKRSPHRPEATRDEGSCGAHLAVYTAAYGSWWGRKGKDL